MLAAVPQALASPPGYQAQVSNLMLGTSLWSYNELKFNTFAGTLSSLSNLGLKVPPSESFSLS